MQANFFKNSIRHLSNSPAFHVSLFHFNFHPPLYLVRKTPTKQPAKFLQKNQHFTDFLKKSRCYPKSNLTLTEWGKDRSIDFHVNNGTKIAITLDPLTFILSPIVGGEGRVRMYRASASLSYSIFKSNHLHPSSGI